MTTPAEERKAMREKAKKVDPKDWHENRTCPNGGPHACHLNQNHLGHCGCEHGFVWLSPREMAIEENRVKERKRE